MNWNPQSKSQQYALLPLLPLLFYSSAVGAGGTAVDRNHWDKPDSHRSLNYFDRADNKGNNSYKGNGCSPTMGFEYFSCKD